MTERTKQQTKRMFGEFLREAAVLVAVFAPLDFILRERSLTTVYFLNTFAIVVFCFWLGVRLGIDSDD